MSASEGLIDAKLGTLSIPTLAFVKEDQLYEILLEVRKTTLVGYNLTRIAQKTLQVQVVKGIPPIMNIL